MPWPCFWVEETSEAIVSLRRFTFQHKAGDCPASEWGHDASADIGVAPCRRKDDGYLEHVDPAAYAEDPRWPTACEACGTAFDDNAERQINQEPIYRRPDTGETWPMQSLPTGTLFDSTWHHHRGVDGISLTAVMPMPDRSADRYDARVAMWHVDGPSYNNGTPGPGWNRTGDPKATPPTVTVTPSINWVDVYHGYLRDGAFTDPV